MPSESTTENTTVLQKQHEISSSTTAMYASQATARRPSAVFIHPFLQQHLNGQNTAAQTPVDTPEDAIKSPITPHSESPRVSVTGEKIMRSHRRQHSEAESVLSEQEAK